MSDNENRTPDVLAAMIRPAMSEAEQLALAYYMVGQVDGDLAVVTSALRNSTSEDVYDEAWELMERAE